MESKFIQTSGGKFHAQVAGVGKNVILVHGYSTQVNSWRTWTKNIAPLAEHFCVYAMDMLGYGESDKPEPKPEAQSQADALVEVFDAEKLATVNLVGLSWGGMITQLVAQKVPARVERLVLVDSAFDSSPASLSSLRQIQCPTLILWDEEDNVLPVKNAQHLAKAIPNSQLRILTRSERDPDANPNWRHWSQMSHSIVWNQLVTVFLSGKWKASSS